MPLATETPALHLDEPDEAVVSGSTSPEQLRDLLEQHGERYQPILAALRDQPWKELVTSRDLLESLASQGLEWSERTLRLYLAEMAEAGLIERHGRRGYRLAPAGAEVARELTVSKRLGSILYHMEETVCRVGGDGGSPCGHHGGCPCPEMPAERHAPRAFRFHLLVPPRPATCR